MYDSIKFALVISTSLLTLAALAPAEEPCVATNGHKTLTFERPDLKADGVPQDAEFTDDDPQAWELDTTSPDDPIPSTSSEGGASASVEIHNHGVGAGGLHAVDKDGSETDLDPEVGDACSDIQVCWTVRFPKKVKSRSWSFGISGLFDLIGIEFGRGDGAVNTVWAEKEICSDSQEVCPC